MQSNFDYAIYYSVFNYSKNGLFRQGTSETQRTTKTNPFTLIKYRYSNSSSHKINIINGYVTGRIY